MREKTFFFFLLINIFNANLTSNLFNPNFLKLGSSLLSSIGLTFSFLTNFNKKNLQFFIDFILMTILLLGLFNSQIDNTVHLFGIFAAASYYSLKLFKRPSWMFFLPSILYGTLLFTYLQFQE